MLPIKDIHMSIMWLILSLISVACAGDVTVQLNVNRPLTDVNEKFVSFAVRPEDLYKALDGPNRKVLTRMASLLSDSYVRFIGDYTFAAENNLRNPTKIIWKGFNRWTRAVNWTMIIPVPFEPQTWDPVVALKILNSSYQLGITDCIWQLGTDFGTSNARDYVTEMKTFHLMVESFKPYVEDWKIIGADISAGSSAEETRRYIEMSKNLNKAFGWTYSSDMISSESMGDYLHMNDASLRMLLTKKVPVWLTMPSLSKVRRFKQQPSKRNAIDETKDGLRWAQTLGEAATNGFDTIFKRLSIAELENPTFAFFVTALFKKTMGSRVFQARPLHIFSNSNKLYTHCANAVSGGIAFMLVNVEDTEKDIVLRSVTKLSNSDVWQYSLTENKGKIYLNNERISINSTLRPQVKKRNANKTLTLSAPASSVTFWVLPNVDIEHCQYTEIEESELESSTSSEKTTEKPNYSSSDRLIRQLIQDTTLPHSAIINFINRRRRYASLLNRRHRRFVLEDKNEPPSNLGDLFDSFGGDQKTVTKRANENIEPTALEWLTNLLSSFSLPHQKRLLKREARSVDDLFGPIFESSEHKTKAITKKITEIRRPERKGKALMTREKFDEEEFFKNVGDQPEPDYMRLPDGDVHLKHIETPEGDEVDDEKSTNAVVEKPDDMQQSMKIVSKEVQNESKPMRLLPTEFYEALPGLKSDTSKMNFGSALNSLLVAEPFSKKASKSKDKETKSETLSDDLDSDKDDNTVLLKDFLRAQKELSKTMLSDLEKDFDHSLTSTERPRTTESPKATASEEKQITISKQEAKLRLLDMLTENLEHYFSEREEKKKTKKEKIDTKDISKKELKDFSWWNFGMPHKKRIARALSLQIPDEAWQYNIITKDDDIKPFGMPVLFDNNHIYEYRTIQPDTTTSSSTSTISNINENDFKNDDDNKLLANEPTSTTTPDVKVSDEITSFQFVSSVKRNVSKFVNIVAHHVRQLYNTVTKHMSLDSKSSSDTIIITPK